MKRQLNFAIILTIAISFVITDAAAQSGETAYAVRSRGKRIFSSANEYSRNVKVDRAFAKSFRDADHISWNKTGGEYIANFNYRDRLAIAWFTKAGMLRCVNYYGTAKDLPAAESKVLSEKYPDYHVTATLEIDKNNIRAYIVTIQSCVNQKKIGVINDELEELETLKLAR